MLSRRIQIGIIAASDIVSPEAVERAKRLAKALVKYNNVLVIVGGEKGLLGVFTQEYERLGGLIVKILPLELEEEYCKSSTNTIYIKTGVTYQLRSYFITRSSDVVICLGGGVGSLIEIMFAYACGIPIVVLKNTGYPTDRLEDFCIDGYIDHRKIVKLYFTENPEEAAKLAVELGSQRLRKLNY